MLNPEEALKYVREVYFSYPKQYELLQQELEKLNNESQDILHVMEFKNLSASEGFRLYKDLQRVRQERRKVKDMIDTLVPVMNMIKQPKPIEKHINNTLGEVRKIKGMKSKRTYRMRVRDDLQGLI